MRMSKRSPKGSRAARALAAALYAVLIAAFVTEFVYLNNPSFILYSFLLFVALGAALGVHSRYTGGVILIAMAFVAAGSMLYFWGAVLLPFVWLNLSIVGYYLLISAVIGITVRMAAESNGLEKRIAAAEKALGGLAGRDTAVYAGIAVAALLLLAPIWPASVAVPQSEYVNRTVYAPHYGNASETAQYQIAASPPPYAYPVSLCANGTGAIADVSVLRTGGAPVYAFLFRNSSTMQKAAEDAAGYPVSTQPGIYRANSESRMYVNSTMERARAEVPDFGCSYMVLLFGNMSSVRVNYSIGYYGQVMGYREERVPNPSAVLVVNGTTDILRSMGYLGSAYVSALAANELNGTASSR